MPLRFPIFQHEKILLKKKYNWLVGERKEKINEIKKKLY